MQNFQTEQEKFWAGKFGDEYIERNSGAQFLASNIALFASILRVTTPLDSLIEVGANIGMNIRALEVLLPSTELHAIEINEKAVQKLQKIERLTQVYHESIINFSTELQYDFVFTKGVLIHLDPSLLQKVYQKLYQVSKKYICIIEYYNPTPMEILYRGHEDKMYKRDFAGEMMQLYPDLELRDYGFVYKNDVTFMQDDLTWFLMEKR